MPQPNRVLDYLFPDRVERRRIESLPTVRERDQAKVNLAMKLVRGEISYPTWIVDIILVLILIGFIVWANSA